MVIFIIYHLDSIRTTDTTDKTVKEENATRKNQPSTMCLRTKRAHCKPIINVIIKI